jgi:hypothetical protein
MMRRSCGRIRRRHVADHGGGSVPHARRHTRARRVHGRDLHRARRAVRAGGADAGWLAMNRLRAALPYVAFVIAVGLGTVAVLVYWGAPAGCV